MKKFYWLLPIFSLFISIGQGESQADNQIWLSWETQDLANLSNDNTGASFALNSDVLTLESLPSLAIMPSGSSSETKLAISFSGAELQAWENYNQLVLEINLPEENTLNPNRFFMGLADVTDAWTWIDGIFGASILSTGWTEIVYTFSAPMRSIFPDRQYTIYLSFFNETQGNKTALNESFYLGQISLSEPDNNVNGQAAIYQLEVNSLLMADEAALLDTVARESFDYFWNEANPDNGLIKDRSTPDSPASIAAVGFGLTAITIGVDRGWISHEEAYQRAFVTLETFANGGVQGENGFYYHFVDMQTGQRVWNSELSSIDTALFIAGALTAGQYFAGTDIETLANELYARINWQWMMNGGNMVSMGWRPDEGFLSATWNHFDESLLLYILAIASPSHPAPVSIWDEMQRPVNFVDEFIYLRGEPLFVYQYPLAYLDLRAKEDAYANYFNNTTRACERNRQYSLERSERYATYQNGVWGISASDGPNGYRAYGAADGNHDGTIAPYASIACLPFTPEASFESMTAMLETYGVLAWGEYGYVSAINERLDWYSTEHIGIDVGDSLLMIANYQDNFVWNLFMQNEMIQQALLDVGFVDSEGDYAVTPNYLENAP